MLSRFSHRGFLLVAFLGILPLAAHAQSAPTSASIKTIYGHSGVISGTASCDKNGYKAEYVGSVAEVNGKKGQLAVRATLIAAKAKGSVCAPDLSTMWGGSTFGGTAGDYYSDCGIDQTQPGKGQIACPGSFSGIRPTF